MTTTTDGNWEPVRELGERWANERLGVEHVTRLRDAIANDPAEWGVWRFTPLPWGKRLLAILYDTQTGNALDNAQRLLLEQAAMYQEDLVDEKYVRAFAEGVLRSRKGEQSHS